MNQLPVQLSYFYSLHCGTCVGWTNWNSFISWNSLQGWGSGGVSPRPRFFTDCTLKKCLSNLQILSIFTKKIGKALRLASDCVVICCEVYRSLFRSIHTHSYRSIHLFFHRMCNPNSQSSSRRFPFLNHFQLVRFDIFANLKIWDFEV